MIRRFLDCILSASLATGLLVAASSANAQNSTAKPIIVGAAIAESGPVSGYDLPSMKSFELAVAATNEAGGINGRKIEILKGDTKSDMALGAQVARDLISRGAEIMVVSADFDYGSPAASAAQAAGVLSVSLGAQSPKFGVQGIGDLAFTVAVSVFSEGATEATFASKSGFKRAFLLLDDTISYTRDMCSGFERAFTQLGGSVVGRDSFKNNDQSFASQITKLKSNNADVVVVCSYLPGAASLIRSVRAAGVATPIISSAAVDGSDWASSVPGLSDFYTTTHASLYGDDPNPKVNALVKLYRQQTGSLPPSSFAIVGYSAWEAIASAIKQAGGKTDGKALASAMEKFDNVDLLLGPTTFSAEAHIPLVRPIRVMKYTNSVPKYLELVTSSVKLNVGGK